MCVMTIAYVHITNTQWSESPRTRNPYVHISHFIIMKMVIPGIFVVAESDSEVKIVITVLSDLIMLFEVVTS